MIDCVHGLYLARMSGKSSLNQGVMRSPLGDTLDETLPATVENLLANMLN